MKPLKNLLLPAALLLTACGGPPGRGDQPVESAYLQELACVSGAIFVGGSFCGGELAITYSGGQTETLPVSIYGAGVGMGLELNLSGRTGSPLPLQLPEDRVTQRELFGRYSGTGWALVIGAGARGRESQSHRDVEIQYAGFGLGVGFWIGKEWLWMRKR